MKKLTTILLFLAFGIFGNAESVSSIIYKKLSAKGIKREIIEETIKLDEEIGDGLLFETAGYWWSRIFGKTGKFAWKG